jgi:hypothetical protein
VAQQSGTRHSWTAPCYVHTRDFVYIHLEDEDIRPVHFSMPWGLVHDENLFYPVVFSGWLDMPPPPPTIV